MAILSKEIFDTFRAVEDIRSGARLSSCVYLRACIDEAMRLSPGVGGILPREVLPGNITVDGHQFSSGTILGTPCYAIHHHPAYYPNPFVYKPERWVANESEGISAESVALAQSAFCPFGIGPRSCAGRYMAYAETSVVVARMIWLFEMRLAQDVGIEDQSNEPDFLKVMRARGEYASVDKFVSKSRGPFIEFRARR